MFIETAWLLLQSYGAWEINAIQTYKHLAPLALKTLQTHRKHRPGIAHTLQLTQPNHLSDGPGLSNLEEPQLNH
jgi:hypothetical protein